MKSEDIKKQIRKLDIVLGRKPAKLNKAKSLRLIENIEKNMKEISKKLDVATFVDTKKEFNNLQKEIKNIKIPSQSPELKKLIIKLEELLSLTELLVGNGNKKELSSIIKEIKNLKNNNQDKEIIKAIKSVGNNIDENKQISYHGILERISKKLTNILQENKSIKQVEVKNFPIYQKISFSKIISAINKLSNRVREILDVKIVNKDRKEAIPVILVDRDKKTFYNASFSSVGSSGYKVVGIENGEGTRISPATEETLEYLAGLSIPKHDDIGMTYDTNNNLTQVQYKNGGTVVATLTLSYDANNNLTSVNKS